MPLKPKCVIEIPDSADTLFDHVALEPETRRVFVAHTARDRLEVIDHDNGCHLATLEGFPEAAGVVADAGHVLVTNRGAASLAWLDGQSQENAGRTRHWPAAERGRDCLALGLGGRCLHRRRSPRPRTPGLATRRRSAMVDRTTRAASMVRDRP